MADWNAKQYLKFGKERTQPAIDLANRMALADPKTVLDLGCGPGNSTDVLAQKFPHANILGIDNSPGMIEAAQNSYPALTFRQCDATKELPLLGQKFDTVFSNACIQWIPDHPKLLREMMELLNPGGVLAIQTPMNYQEPIHQIIDRTVKNKRWSTKIDNPRIFYNLTQAQYFDLLSELTDDFSMWQTTYFHKMPDHQAIIEWYSSTGMKPYLDALEDGDKAAFTQDIYDEIVKAYPVQANGSIIFRFPRFFFLAKKV